MQLVENGGIELCVSPEILGELKATLAYPKLQKFHRHDSKWIAAFIRELSEMARVTPGKIIIEIIKEDPSDNIYLACALEGLADFIISGDHHLANLGKFRDIRIVNPAAFLKALDQEL